MNIHVDPGHTVKGILINTVISKNHSTCLLGKTASEVGLPRNIYLAITKQIIVILFYQYIKHRCIYDTPIDNDIDDCNHYLYINEILLVVVPEDTDIENFGCLPRFLGSCPTQGHRLFLSLFLV